VKSAPIVVLTALAAAAAWLGSVSSDWRGAVAVAALLTVGAAIHALRRTRDGRLAGSPAQNLGQVYAFAVGLSGTGALLLGAFVLAIFSGYCEDYCDPKPSSTSGLLAAAAVLGAAVAFAIGAVAVWRRLQRRRAAATPTTPRWTLFAPAGAAWLVAAVAGVL
jgi:hypothetical protein